MSIKVISIDQVKKYSALTKNISQVEKSLILYSFMPEKHSQDGAKTPAHMKNLLQWFYTNFHIKKLELQ